MFLDLTLEILTQRVHKSKVVECLQIFIALEDGTFPNFLVTNVLFCFMTVSLVFVFHGSFINSIFDTRLTLSSSAKVSKGPCNSSSFHAISS